MCMHCECLNITLTGSISFGGGHKVISNTYYQVIVVFEFVSTINSKGRSPEACLSGSKQQRKSRSKQC